MPPLRKNEKAMLVLIGVALVVFVAMDPYYLVWKKKPLPPAKEEKRQGAQTATAPAKTAAGAVVAKATGGEAFQRTSTVATERMPFEGWRRDPFVQTRAYLDERVDLSDLKLGAISVRKQDRYALINSRVVRMGDIISGMVVDRIERDRVVLVSGGRSYTLTWER